MKRIIVNVLADASHDTYGMRWEDPATGKACRRSTGVSLEHPRREALRVAKAWQRALQSGKALDLDLTWGGLRERWEDFHNVACPYRVRYFRRSFRHFERIAPLLVLDINRATILEFGHVLFSRGLVRTARQQYLWYVRSVLNWGYLEGLTLLPIRAKVFAAAMYDERPSWCHWRACRKVGAT